MIHASKPWLDLVELRAFLIQSDSGCVSFEHQTPRGQRACRDGSCYGRAGQRVRCNDNRADRPHLLSRQADRKARRPHDPCPRTTWPPVLNRQRRDIYVETGSLENTFLSSKFCDFTQVTYRGDRLFRCSAVPPRAVSLALRCPGAGAVHPAHILPSHSGRSALASRPFALG